MDQDTWNRRILRAAAFALAIPLALLGACTSDAPSAAGADGGASSDACQPATCAAQGKTCGTVPDGCGGTLDCGACTGDTCTPTTCAEQKKDCGTLSDGCGAMLDCGTCDAPQSCGAGGTANVCGCVPTTCAAANKNCGTMPDGCGGTLSCGTCAAGDTCGAGNVPNVCGKGTCTPTTCAAEKKDCGTISDGCASTLPCGTCTSPASCGGGGTANVCACKPTTCGAVGATCGSVPDGCGGTLSCGTCTLPKTCGGGGVANTCGVSADAGPPSSTDPSGFLSADRATTWNPGLNAVGGIPARSTVCATKAPRGGGLDDTDAIQAAINACPAGQVVALTAGTFTLDGGGYLLLNKGITLRGAGPGQTLLQKTDGAKPGVEATGSNASPLIIVGPSRWPSDAGSVSATLAGDAVKGSFSVTVDNAAGFAAGQVVLLDELSGATWQTDPGGRGQILASSDWRVVYQKHKPDQGTDDPIDYTPGVQPIGSGSDATSWFSRQDRVTSEWKKIASVTGNTITFSTPMHIDYRASHKGQVTRYPQDSHVSGAGIEDLAVKGGDNGNIRFERAAESWAKNVESSVWHDEGFAVDSSFRIELREFYVHDAAWAQPGGAGYAISLAGGSSEVLVENGISIRANKVMVSRCSGAGSVVGYNYVDDGYINSNGAWIEIGLNGSHMVGPHHMLFEGNYGFNADSDKTHGNSTYHTFYRNHLRGVRAPFTNQLGGTIDDGAQPGNGPQRCAGLGYYSYWMSFVGNVMGAPGKMGGFVYETTFTGGSGIWMLGWDDWSPYPTDAKVATTTLRHGNYDYLTNSVHWDPTIADHTLPSSLYLAQKPAFFSAGAGYTWPWVDSTSATPLHTLPAKARYDAGTPFVQP